MNRKEFIQAILPLLVICLILPGILFSAVGKIRGTITDAETGEPLELANIHIPGSSMGSTSDVNGEFMYAMRTKKEGHIKITMFYTGEKPIHLYEVF